MIDKLTIFIIENQILSYALLAVSVSVFVLEYLKAGKSISPYRVVKMMNDDDALIVDIRVEKDFRQGHIQGAVNIPLSKIKEQTVFFQKHRHKPIVLVCNSGFSVRSLAENMLIQGFDVTRLSGGLNSWIDLKLPLNTKR